MNNRRFNLLTFAAIALCALFIPSTANAQGSIWDRIRDRAEQERDRDYRNNRRDDEDDRYGRDDRYGNHRSGRISDYERRTLRDAARRVNSRSKDFQRNLDRVLDDSRYNGSRREDHINDDVSHFRNAAERFKDRAGSDNDLNRSVGEARALIEAAQHVESYLRGVRLDSRTRDDWSQIRNDLRAVADIYGLRFNSNGGYRNGGYGNGGYGNGGYGRDDRYEDYRNDRRDRRDDRWPN